MYLPQAGMTVRQERGPAILDIYHFESMSQVRF